MDERIGNEHFVVAKWLSVSISAIPLRVDSSGRITTPDKRPPDALPWVLGKDHGTANRETRPTRGVDKLSNVVGESWQFVCGVCYDRPRCRVRRRQLLFSVQRGEVTRGEADRLRKRNRAELRVCGGHPSS